MRKVFQREWFGIEFSAFTRTSTRSLADAAFYQAFYATFFERYQSWDNLDLAWRESKRNIAQFILNNVDTKNVILSIGCGLGWIEHCLLEMTGGTMHLEATEMSDKALRWIKKEVPMDRLYVGPFPKCLPPSRKYDLIYMSALDYCLDQPSLIGLLTQVTDRLTTGGRCLLISASFDHSVSAWRKSLRMAKGILAATLEAANLDHRGQFWGWTRTREDYHSVFSHAGYTPVLIPFSFRCFIMASRFPFRTRTT